jgi:hypothetical protein
MDKDFNYDKFIEFMQSIGGLESVYAHSDDPTQNILNKIDQLEENIGSRPMYNSAEDMMNAIKGI